VLIAEILMLIAGICAIIEGKIPSFLLGGARYKLEGRGVRWLGLILVIPLPVAYAVGVVLPFLFGAESAPYAVGIELMMVLVCATAAVVVSRYIRRPVMPAGADGDNAQDLANIQAVIAKKAQGSLIYALLGILGFTAILVCPLAFIRANQALRLIDKHHVGEEHRGKANAARVLAPIVFLFYTALVAILVVLVILGT